MYFLVRCKKVKKKKKKKKKRMGCDSQGITPLSVGPLFLITEKNINRRSKTQ